MSREALIFMLIANCDQACRENRTTEENFFQAKPIPNYEADDLIAKKN